ncbi:MAG: c-type cytochrome [Chloroflexi bacterium]|nr:c-type cytochrome [Chloroflexota bacterium]
MRAKRLSLTTQLILTALLLAGSAMATWLLTAGPSVASAQEDAISKGRAMARTVCMECHSPRVAGDPYRLDPAKLFAGDEPFEGPWGTVYASNITSDRETGISAWTDAELKRAIVEGIARDGTKLLVMPWELFRGLADEDINNIVAYLRTVPAVRHTPPAAQLAPPEAVAGFINSVPPLRAAVPPSLFSSPRAVFHDYFFATSPSANPPAPPGFQAPQGKDSPARGGYLVKNLLGCTFCHAPNLAGGTAPIFAPNITPDIETGIGLWTKEEIVRVLREGLRPTGLLRREGVPRPEGQAAPGVRLLSPGMPSTTAFVNLSDDEVYNVVAYLKSIPAVRRAPEETNPAFPGPPPPPRPAPVAAPVPVALPRTGDAGTLWLVLTPLAGAAALASGLLLRRRRA